MTNLLSPSQKLDLLLDLARNLSSGNYRSLFRYLQDRKDDQLVAAQESAFAGDSQNTLYCVLATRLYDELLSWQDTKNGALAQEVEKIRRDIEAEREAEKLQGEDHE